MENQTEQPVQEVVNQTPVEQPVAQPEKTSILRSKWLKIGIVLILLVLLGRTFVIGVKLINKPRAPILTPVAAGKPTQIPNPNDISNWTDADGSQTSGVVFKFPPGWHLQWQGFNNKLAALDNSPEGESDQNSPKNVLILFDDTPTTKTSIESYYQTSQNYEAVGGARVSNKSLTVVDGYQALKFELNYNGEFSQTTEFIKSGIVYEITMSANNQTTIDNNLNLYQEILSTFKFTK